MSNIIEVDDWTKTELVASMSQIELEDNDKLYIVKLENTVLSFSPDSDCYYKNYSELIGNRVGWITPIDKEEVLVYILNTVLKAELNLYFNAGEDIMVIRKNFTDSAKARTELENLLAIVNLIIIGTYIKKDFGNEAGKESLITDSYKDKHTAISNIYMLFENSLFLSAINKISFSLAMKKIKDSLIEEN